MGNCCQMQFYFNWLVVEFEQNLVLLELCTNEFEVDGLLIGCMIGRQI